MLAFYVSLSDVSDVILELKSSDSRQWSTKILHILYVQVLRQYQAEKRIECSVSITDCHHGVVLWVRGSSNQINIFPKRSNLSFSNWPQELIKREKAA